MMNMVMMISLTKVLIPDENERTVAKKVIIKEN